MLRLRPFDSLCYQLPQFQVVLRQHKSSKFQPTDLSNFHRVEPAEGIAQESSVFVSIRGVYVDDSFEVVVVQVTFLMLVKISEESDAVKMIDLGQLLSVGLKGGREQD